MVKTITLDVEIPYTEKYWFVPCFACMAEKDRFFAGDIHTISPDFQPTPTVELVRDRGLISATWEVVTYTWRGACAKCGATYCAQKEITR